MNLKKFFPVPLILTATLFLSCESTKKEPVPTAHVLNLSLMVDEDPYEGAARNFSLRDVSRNFGIETNEEGEEVTYGIYPLSMLEEFDEEGEPVLSHTDRYTVSIDPGEYRLYEGERDLNAFITVDEEKTQAVYVECTSIDAAANALKSIPAPSGLILSVKEKTYQTLGYDNLLQRTLASCKNPVSMNISGCINTGVGYRAFYGCPTLKSIILPESISALEKDLFTGCSSLRHVNIPSRVSSIAGGTFSSCTSLDEIEMSPGNAFFKEVDGCILSSDGAKLIAWPAAKGAVVVPESVEVICEYGFSGCSGLESVELSSTIEIEKYAFLGCTSLTQLDISRSLFMMENSALEGCTSLSQINVESGNPSFKSRGGILMAYDNRRLLAWPSAQGSVKIPEGVTRIDDNAFQNQSGLKSVSLSSTVKEIGSQAFTSCADLTSIDMPSVVSIEAYAFSKCPKLVSVSIPETVRRCDGSAFAGCTSLENISVASGNTQYKSIGGAVYTADGKTLVEWPAAKGDVTVSSSVQSIGTFAFNGCSELKSVSLPSVESIGHHAFDACKSLESVDLGPSVVSIGSHAFSNCLSIKSLYIPETVTVIKNYAFWFWSSDQKILCQAPSKPSGWDFAWNADSDAVLVWGAQKPTDAEPEE
ncbi:MAG: leucine-rich repeat domain-containing protein [Treponema sp.]|nr:leucine-rich repeat domain-containing protein [Treponema sp.]